MCKLRRNLRERHRVVGPLRKLGMRPLAEYKQIDIDRTRLQARIGDPSDRTFDLTRDALERFAIEVGFDLSRDVEERRTVHAVGRLALVERRDASDPRICAQTLQGRENVRLPVSEVRTYTDVDVHTYRS